MNPRKWPRSALVILIAVVVVVGGAIGIGFGVASTTDRSTPSAAPTTSQKPSIPTPTATAVPALYGAATFPGWSVSSSAGNGGAGFAAQVEGAEDGKAALRIDATGSARPELQQTVVTQPLTDYVITVWSRAQIPTKKSTVELLVGAGDRATSLPSDSAVWRPTALNYKTAAGETSVSLRLSAVGPTDGFLVDDLQLAVAGGSSLVQNGSFEQYSTPPTQVTNTSLIMPTRTSALDLNWFTRGVRYAISDEDGVTVASGTQPIEGGAGAISLAALPQGYYSVALSNVDNPSDVINTTFALLDPAADGAPTQDDRSGITVHSLDAPYAGVAPVAAQLGFGTVREDVPWGAQENVKGQYSFQQKLTDALAAYTSNHISVLPIADYPDRFYDGGKTPSSPDGIQGFANYANAVVDQYGQSAVEIFNEFNNPQFNTSACGTAGVCYVQLLKASYQAIKADHPGTQVVGPAIAREDDSWLEGMLQAGGLQYLDAVSIHPYPNDTYGGPEYLATSLPKTEALIAQYNNGQPKPLWISELGWSTDKPDILSENTMGDYAVRVQAIAFATGVQKYYGYDLVDDGTDPNDHQDNFGYLRAPTSTVPAFSPKPAAMTQALLVRQIAGKNFTSRDQLSDSSYSYVYGTGSSAVRIAWATTPTVVDYAATKTVTVTDDYGKVTKLKPHGGVVSVQLTTRPVYLDSAVTGAALASAAPISVKPAQDTFTAQASLQATITATVPIGAGSIAVVIEGRTYTIRGKAGATVSRVITLPPGSAVGVRTVAGSAGSPGAPNIYFAFGMTVSPPGAPTSPSATSSPPG